jgi:hypothetical protein
VSPRRRRDAGRRRPWAWALTVALSLAGWGSCKRAAPRAPAPPPPAAAPAGVEVWPGLIESGSTDLAVGWTAPWLNGTIVLKEGHAGGRADRRLVNCADLEGVRETDVELGPQWQRDDFKEKSIRCRALALVRRATAPRVGYLAQVVSSNDPGDLLPAALSPGAAKPGQTGSWRAADPTLSFDRATARANYRELVVRGAYQGRLIWWASGDFNGDGVADAVVFLNLARSADLNAPNVMRAFVLTRRQPAGAVTVLERIE